MIKLVKDERTLKKYRGRDIYSCRILSLAAVYGFGYDFLRFYVQQTGSAVSAVISVLDSDITVSFDSAAADMGEIAYFLRMTGFQSLLCSSGLKLDFAFEEGAVMKNGAGAKIVCRNIDVTQTISLKQLYDFTDTHADFEYWYADISHRIRHGGAGVYAVQAGGEIISAALLSAIYENSAVLSAVKTARQYRGQGFSSAVISFISASFGGDIYLMRRQGENKSFYEKLGFEDIGRWRMYR